MRPKKNELTSAVPTLVGIHADVAAIQKAIRQTPTTEIAELYVMAKRDGLQSHGAIVDEIVWHIASNNGLDW